MPPFSRLPTARPRPAVAASIADAPVPLRIEPLTEVSFAPFGTMLGARLGARTQGPSFSNVNTDFWHQHAFDTGAGGRTEVLWVNYRRNDGYVDTLEVHHLTQQAIVPLGSRGVLHVVALSDVMGAPDLATLRAFDVRPGEGVCMHPGCWHATQVASDEVTCLMLTRDSTTIDLVAHLQNGAPAQESALQTLTQAYVLAR